VPEDRQCQRDEKPTKPTHGAHHRAALSKEDRSKTRGFHNDGMKKVRVTPLINRMTSNWSMPIVR